MRATQKSSNLAWERTIQKKIRRGLRGAAGRRGSKRERLRGRRSALSSSGPNSKHRLRPPTAREMMLTYRGQEKEEGAKQEEGGGVKRTKTYSPLGVTGEKSQTAYRGAEHGGKKTSDEKTAKEEKMEREEIVRHEGQAHAVRPQASSCKV